MLHIGALVTSWTSNGDHMPRARDQTSTAITTASAIAVPVMAFSRCAWAPWSRPVVTLSRGVGVGGPHDDRGVAVLGDQQAERVRVVVVEEGERVAVVVAVVAVVVGHLDRVRLVRVDHVRVDVVPQRGALGAE